MVADPDGLGVHRDVRRALETAAEALRAGGYLVDELPDVPRLQECLDSLALDQRRAGWRKRESPLCRPPP
jgi:hypothetical protein